MLQEIVSDGASSTSSIATNYKKKPNNRANFMSFFDTLGKTTKQATDKTKSPKSIITKETTKYTKDEITAKISPSKASNIAKSQPKNLKNNIDVAPKIPSNIATNPQTLALKDSNPSPITSLLMKETAPIVKTATQENTPNAVNLATNTQNQTINTESNNADLLNTDSLDIKSSSNTKDVSQKSPIDTQKTAKKDISSVKTSPNDLKISSPNIKTESSNSPTQDSANAQITDTIEDATKNIVQNATQNIIPQTNISPNITQNTLDSAPKDIPQNLPKQDLQNTTNPLGIKNTLKYGTFKAFDAISLLKPSNGKKISELIKKADELALNLEKIKYSESKSPNDAKSSTPNISPNPISPPLDSNPKDSSVELQNAPKEPLKEALNTQPKDSPKEPQKDSQKDSQSSKTAPKNDEVKPQDSTNNNAQKDSNLAKNTKNDMVKDAPSTSDMNESQNSKTAEVKNDDIKPANFKQQEKREVKNDEIKHTKAESNIESKHIESTNNLKTEQMQKSFDAKETMKSFVNALRQEIINYKPPLSKITLELNPTNLGSVEVSITHQGKNIQVALNANQSTLNLFIQNQTDLRASLNQIGYENVTMSFSNGSQMGFSDSSGNWSFYNADSSPQHIGNENSLENDEMANLEITIVNNYA